MDGAELLSAVRYCRSISGTSVCGGTGEFFSLASIAEVVLLYLFTMLNVGSWKTSLLHSSFDTDPSPPLRCYSPGCASRDSTSQREHRQT